MQEPWLLELHKKLWKQESTLRSSLFRTDQVTRAHYSELQTRLHAAHPTRNSKTYQAKNVISIKLDILQKFKGSPDVDPDDDDEDDPDVNDNPKVNDQDHPDVSMENGSGDDDDEYDPDDDLHPDELFQFLPATIQYVDITPLKLQLLPRVAFPLLFRDEYKVMSTILDSRRKGVDGSCLITGQQSAGKTSYLYILLIDRLLRGLDTIFQSKKGRIYEISNTVRELPLFTSPTLVGHDVLALVDADGSQTAPLEEVCDSRARIVVTSSPKDEKSRRWMKQLPGGVLATTYMINPFSLEEFLLTGIFLHPLDVTYARLNTARKRLGNNPSCGFYASASPSGFKEQVALINEQISAVPASTTNIVALICDIRSGGKFSHHLFQIDSSDADHLFANCQIKHVSDWSFNKLLEKYEERQAARELFNLIRKEPQIASINGVIWKRQCHLFFRSLRSPREFILRSLDDPNKFITWDYPGCTTSYQTFEYGSFLTRLQARINDGTSGYLMPASTTTFPTLDSLVYRPDRLDFLQMTVDMVHPSNIAGFERIQRWLKLKSPASSHLRASKARPWIFIFIVPEETAASFMQQSFGKVWDEKVKQYVLGLSQKDVWEY